MRPWRKGKGKKVTELLFEVKILINFSQADVRNTETHKKPYKNMYGFLCFLCFFKFLVF